MVACPACGREVADEFPFCPYCTAPLTEPSAAQVLEERKIVSVLFCDLVGFTEASEAADPEDVRARLLAYHARVREEIARHGGTVEKFVGDAVMAVFGAPTAHEDDAERAVRAGIRILAAIEELNVADPRLSLRVRVGINTGEVVVALGAKPEEGEGIVVGDVVNTASRLQAAAPVNGIAVSEQTKRATERSFEYETLGPVQAKGKAEPLAVYRPLGHRADAAPAHANPLVGREPEKRLLIEAFESSARERSCRLVTIVGEPGAGKSRLCAELLGHVGERPGPVTWREGRCLPYGEGIAFWALGEIVKAECGILESDSPEVAQEKLGGALPADDPDLHWLEARLAPLVGAPAAPASQGESFTAWRRFCSLVAERGPTVLVLEDLHWADSAMLSFLEYLAAESQGVPLLLLCTTRPELFGRQPGWASSLANAGRLELSPLDDEETARLISSLLEIETLPPETRRSLLERAGGNPLYAEEFARLMADRDMVDGEIEVPDSVQGLIAARLDTLSLERKSVLQDAAVVGKTFWAGAVVEMGNRDPEDVAQALDELARDGFVRPGGTSSMAGEVEYDFWHVLVRDVCYGQITRTTRASRHEAAAIWIERKTGERVEDLADVLAHHYLTALDLVRATGRADGQEELQAAALRYLTLAGERALTLDIDRAEEAFSRALELCPDGYPGRGHLLERWARTLGQQNRLRESLAAFRQALDEHRQRGDLAAVGRVLGNISLPLSYLGDAHAEESLAEAIDLLEAQPPGPELVTAYTHSASFRLTNREYEEAIAASDRATSLAFELGVPEPVDAIGHRGAARACLGDDLGVEEMRRAQAVAAERGESGSVAALYNNLAVVVAMYQGPRPSLDLAREGIEFAERRGLRSRAEFIEATVPLLLSETGRADAALAEAESIAGRLERTGNVNFVFPRSLQFQLLAERGAAHEASADAALAAARASGEAQVVESALARAARLLVAQGRIDDAHDALTDLRSRIGPAANAANVRTALTLGDRALARDLFDGAEPVTPRDEHEFVTCRAQLAEAAGHHSEATELYADAAARWLEFGNVPERAYALLGHGRCLLALGDSGAETPLAEARGLFRSMGYEPALRETEQLLAHAAAPAP